MLSVVVFKGMTEHYSFKLAKILLYLTIAGCSVCSIESILPKERRKWLTSFLDLEVRSLIGLRFQRHINTFSSVLHSALQRQVLAIQTLKYIH